MTNLNHLDHSNDEYVQSFLTNTPLSTNVAVQMTRSVDVNRVLYACVDAIKILFLKLLHLHI